MTLMTGHTEKKKNAQQYSTDTRKPVFVWLQCAAL